MHGRVGIVDSVCCGLTRLHSSAGRPFRCCESVKLSLLPGVQGVRQADTTLKPKP